MVVKTSLNDCGSSVGPEVCYMGRAGTHRFVQGVTRLCRNVRRHFVLSFRVTKCCITNSTLISYRDLGAGKLEFFKI